MNTKINTANSNTDLRNLINSKLQDLGNIDSLDPNIIKNLGEWLRMELTYNSNAIEGNTLTRQETKLVIEDGISVGGKSVTEILEVKNHNDALIYIEHLAKKTKLINDFAESNLLEIHSLILKGINDMEAGKYRSVPVRISGSGTILPNYLKVPLLMDRFFEKFYKMRLLDLSPLDIIDFAIEAHFEIVTIHPFVDGNGRTARLLFNFILLQKNLPISFISKENRSIYLLSLEKAQNGGSKEDYHYVMLSSILRSINLYLDQKNNAQTSNEQNTKLLKIGQLAKASNESVSNIRYWTKLGLLTIFNHTESGYSLYHSSQIAKAKQIRFLQKEKRLTLEEIRNLT